MLACSLSLVVLILCCEIDHMHWRLVIPSVLMCMQGELDWVGQVVQRRGSDIHYLSFKLGGVLYSVGGEKCMFAMVLS